MGLLDQLRSFGQGASNTAASNVSAPIDALAWLLRKGGLPIPQNPVGGSDWMAQRGLTAEPQNRLAGLLGEGFGGVAPIVAAAKAPQIAGGLLRMGENAAAATPLNNATRGQLGATVWHGSPHKFDKFDSSKIGTGEGAQAYGHGLYLAESPKVAKDYQLKLSKPDFTTMSDGNKVSEGLQGLLSDSYSYLSKRQPNVTRFDAIEDVVNQIPKNSPYYKEAQHALRYPPQEGGSLYKVDLPDEHIAKMLDWDKPLSQQHPDVLSAMGYHNKPRDFEAEAKAIYGTPEYVNLEKLMDTRVGSSAVPDVTGSEWYRSTDDLLRGSNADEAGRSAYLKSLGIPGIRYLDGGSRGAGTGSSNFVVFPGNENMLSILERNGKGLLAP